MSKEPSVSEPDQLRSGAGAAHAPGSPSDVRPGSETPASKPQNILLCPRCGHDLFIDDRKITTSGTAVTLREVVACAKCRTEVKQSG